MGNDGRLGRLFHPIASRSVKSRPLWLTRWFSKESPKQSPSTSVVLASIEVAEADQQKAMDWFADQESEWIALGRDSLCALAQASPQPVDPSSRDAPLAWLQEALVRLDALSEQSLPRQPANAIPWRYLIFVRVLCDALETAHQAALRRGQPMHCPLTRRADTHRHGGYTQHTSWIDPDAYSGLGTLLAGLWLPKTGQKWLYSALAQGIEWTNVTAFWAQVEGQTAEPGTSALTRVSPQRKRGFHRAAAMSASSSTAASAQDTERAPSASATRPVPECTDAAPTPVPPPSRPDAEIALAPPPSRLDAEIVPAPPPGTDPLLDTPLSKAVRHVLQNLTHNRLFNHQNGPGWRTEDAYWVTAKPFAEILMEQPWVKTPAFQGRREIYQCMGRQGLLLPQGADPIWVVFVADPGTVMPRRVSALKLPLGLGPPSGQLYQGRLQQDNPWILSSELPD